MTPCGQVHEHFVVLICLVILVVFDTVDTPSFTPLLGFAIALSP